MQNVTVRRNELLEKLRTNRSAHRELFLKAQIGYREAVIKELDSMLQEAREQKPIRRSVEMPEPVDCTKEYDRVIAMLEMSTDDEITLLARDFQQYVLDDWGWKEQVTATNFAYASRT